ncbi:MAG: radical SAM protein, partial [Candidatus Bathyarchaeota archaeon]
GPLFEKIINEEEIPELVQGEVVPENEIPIITGPTICGLVEITRGCGRGCDFCVPDMLKHRMLPIDHILREVDVNLKAGREPLLHAEDVLRYGAKRLEVNKEAVINLFRQVKNHPGVKSVAISHFCLSSVASAPDVVEEISRILELGKPGGQVWVSGQTGIETGSPRLIKKHMLGKCRPFKPEEWPDMVVNAFEILTRNHWVPCATMLVGLPGETDEDVEITMKMVEKLRDFKSVIVPMLVVSMDVYPEAFTVEKMTEKQGELFLTCWEHDLKWSEMLMAEYVSSCEDSVTGGLKSIMSFTVSSVTELLHKCRDEYHSNIPAMIRDYKENAEK